VTLRAVVLPLLLFAVVAVVWVSQCSGPHPSVDGAPRVTAPVQPGDSYKVEAAIRNDGPGHGEARVTIRLIDTASGQAYEKQEPVDLEHGETARVIVEIPAPVADYRPEVEVVYPPD
jgi:hypothetical protein